MCLKLKQINSKVYFYSLHSPLDPPPHLILRGQCEHFKSFICANIFPLVSLSLNVPVRLGVLIISAEVGQHREYPGCHVLTPFLLVIKTAVDSTGKSIAAIHLSY